MTTYEQILYEKTGAIATVTMNRARYRNAQSRLMREEMDDAFTRAVDDDEVRVIVLAGAGDHFSSGHDLGTPEEKADQERRPYPEGVPGSYKRTWDLNVENSLRWRDLPKPTIAAVQGYCIWGGWIIASAMDLIVAADDAKFLPAHFQYFSVPWDLGVRKAKEILFQNRLVLAEEALELGFVNQVVPRADLDSTVRALAEKIAETDPFLTKMVKYSINQAQDHMGFRTAVRGAHSTFMVISQAGALGARPSESGKKRIGGVADALKAEDTKGAPAAPSAQP
jgi:enoyl-CoA hydratase